MVDWLTIRIPLIDNCFDPVNIIAANSRITIEVGNVDLGGRIGITDTYPRTKVSVLMIYLARRDSPIKRPNGRKGGIMIVDNSGIEYHSVILEHEDHISTACEQNL